MKKIPQFVQAIQALSQEHKGRTHFTTREIAEKAHELYYAGLIKSDADAPYFLTNHVSSCLKNYMKAKKPTVGFILVTGPKGRQVKMWYLNKIG